MGTKPSIFQPDHTGKQSAVNIHPGMHSPARGAEAFVGHSVCGNIARDGAPKNHRDVPIHGGMTAQQQAMRGMGHPMAGAPDASSANPLDPEAPAKRLAPVAIVPGQRSRTSDCDDALHAARGRAMIDQAIAASCDPTHPANVARRLQGKN
jgi:hypothetical protein